MKNFRYKKYVPNELGKIIFFEDLIPKKVLRQQFLSNLFTLFFSIFGLVICILMFSHFIISNDLFGLFFALLFSPFFFYLYKSILNFFIIEIGIVCDKGIMILHLRSDDKLIKNRTSIQQEDTNILMTKSALFLIRIKKFIVLLLLFNLKRTKICQNKYN